MSPRECDCPAPPCTCAPRPAEPTGELREAVVETLHAQGCREDSDGSGCGGHCVDDADALLAGPLAPLLAKLRAVEELHTELAAERPSDHPLIAALANRLRRALDGT